MLQPSVLLVSEVSIILSTYSTGSIIMLSHLRRLFAFVCFWDLFFTAQFGGGGGGGQNTYWYRRNDADFTDDGLPTNKYGILFDKLSSVTGMVVAGITKAPEEEEEAAGRPTTAPARGPAAPHHRPPRVFLGIFSVLDEAVSARRAYRHQIRKTYLSNNKFDNNDEDDYYNISSSSTTRSTVCSLEEFSLKKQLKVNDDGDDDDWGPHECQLVYTFLFGGNLTRNKENTPPSQWRSLVDINGTGDNVLTRRISISWMPMFRPREIADLKTAKDYTFFNADERYPSYQIWSWHQYALRHWKGAFDYIAHMDAHVMLRPAEFWQNPIFREADDNGSSRLIHGGLNANDSVIADERERFTLLSHDLVEVLQDADPETTYGTSDDGLILFQNATSTTTTTTLDGGKITSVVPLEGFECYHHQQSTIDNEIFMKMWDRYKDPLVRAKRGYVPDPVDVALAEASNATRYFSDKEKRIPSPRILLGIFTMDSETERERRAAVRSTYLSYYQKNAKQTPHRICSLHQLLRGVLPNNGADCQMAYAFVMGSNPNGPAILLEPNSTFPITVTDQDGDEYEEDIVHLNIRENMEDGKSSTWFKYATALNDGDLWNNNPNMIYFDYVAKTDTDTLIYPDRFLDGIFAKHCPAFPGNVRVYGGRFCIDSQYRLLGNMIGPGYFAGEFYWMSADLARFVSSTSMSSAPRLESSTRQAKDSGVEDHAMSNFVHSHPLPIRRVYLPKANDPRFHVHPLKDVDKFVHKWRTYIHP